MYIDKQVFKGLQQLEGVSGVSIIDNMGEILHSTIKEADINELASFISSISSILASDKHLGEVNKITLKSPKGENLIVHIMDDKIVVSTLSHKASCTITSQKIGLLLEEYTEVRSINARMNTPTLATLKEPLIKSQSFS